jgi:hypothetical protein
MSPVRDHLSPFVLPKRPHPLLVPKTICDFRREVSMIRNVSERMARLEEFIKRLEKEMRKVDAFKRELPLYMNLLIDN